MRRAATLTALAVLALGACSSPEAEPSASASNVGDIDLIVVGQSETLAPSLEFEHGLDYEEPQTSLLWDGEGAALQDGQPVLLDIYSETLTDGTPVINTFDGSPQPFILSPDIMGEAAYEVLLDAHVGARILTIAPAELNGDEPPVAIVVDVLSERATGEVVEPLESMPEVNYASTGEPRITIPADTDPPADLAISTLIRGSGPQVTPESHLVLNYKVVYWSDGSLEASGDQPAEEWSAGDEFDSTWAPEQKPLELDMSEASAVQGLAQGLLNQTQGSQVLLVVPPTMGYPLRGTMVFVVDILDVWNPVTA